MDAFIKEFMGLVKRHGDHRANAAYAEASCEDETLACNAASAKSTESEIEERLRSELGQHMQELRAYELTVSNLRAELESVRQGQCLMQIAEPAAPQAVQPVLGWVHKLKNGKIGSHFYLYEPHCDCAVRDDGGEKIAVAATLPAQQGLDRAAVLSALYSHKLVVHCDEDGDPAALVDFLGLNDVRPCVARDEIEALTSAICAAIAAQAKQGGA